ncbi:unnamed protein product, partial [Litomosoides sigmodontis]
VESAKINVTGAIRPNNVLHGKGATFNIAFCAKLFVDAFLKRNSPSIMSLDKTVENVNLMLSSVSSSLNELLIIFRWGTLLFIITFCLMAIALTVLCCYVKCYEIKNANELRKIDETNRNDEDEKIYLAV